MISNNVNDNNNINNNKSNKIIIMRLVIIMIVITIGIRELSVAITIIAKQRSMLEQRIDTSTLGMGDNRGMARHH